MTQNSYTSMGLRTNRINPNQLNHHNNGLRTLVDSSEKILHVEELSLAYINDLKRLLDHRDIPGLIEDIFSIEHHLNVLSESFSLHDEDCPDLDHFYRKLSPILLQSLHEKLEIGADQDDVCKGWLEALRIAVEEEIYIWQEKMHL